MKILVSLALLLLPGLALAQPSSLQTNYSGMFGWNSSLNKWTGIPYSNGGLAVSPTLPATSTAINGTTSATAGTWTEALAGSAGRGGCEIEDTGSAVIQVGFGPSAPTQSEFSIGPGYPISVNCIDQQSVWVSSSTASVTYSGASW